MYGGFPTFNCEEELIALKKIEIFFSGIRNRRAWIKPYIYSEIQRFSCSTVIRKN